MNSNVTKYATLPTWVSHNLNSLALFSVCLALGMAFYYQLAFDELPCPLCLLQRAGLILIGLGLLFNVRFGVRCLHYGTVLIAAVATGAIAIRQVLMHITLGSGSYGSVFLGFHFYTWAAIAAVLTVVFVAAMLLLQSWERPEPQRETNLLGKVAMCLFIVMIAANLGSTMLQCGFGQCADMPTSYQWLNGA